MKFINFTLNAVVLTAILVQTACTPTNLTKENVIPKPVSVVSSGSSFDLTDQTDIYVQGESLELKQIGQYLANKLNPSTGLSLDVKTTVNIPAPGNIYLCIKGGDAELGDEGYAIDHY